MVNKKKKSKPKVKTKKEFDAFSEANELEDKILKKGTVK
jgi:hypothetical protein